MNSAANLIAAVERAGGRLSIEDDWLVIEPRSAGVPVLAQLRSHKSEIIEILKNRDYDPAPWRAHFDRWRSERTVSRPGRDDASGVGCLLLDFAQWSVQHDGIPARRETFERLLADSGHVLQDGMAGGIVLRADVAAHAEFARFTHLVRASDASRAAKKSKKEQRYE